MSTTGPLKAPFTWFGGKSRVAARVWRALGDVDHYVEPFAGSLAVLLARPPEHAGYLETANDADRYLANFWRAVQRDPQAVAHWADWPVNECDLFARHLWLVNTGRERIAALESDPDYYDAKAAGWWVWGLNCWIAEGWCSGKGSWRLVNGQVVREPAGEAGRGVWRKRPRLGKSGAGVHCKKLQCDQGASLLRYLKRLAARLRRVRVCCGDWSRVLTAGALTLGGTIGVFLDPPYSGEVRKKGIYSIDDHEVAVAVREWAIAHGDDPRYRIALCGYHQEHAASMPPSWRCHRYSGPKSYGTSASARSGRGNAVNRHNEAIWFSPHCLRDGDAEQLALFGREEFDGAPRRLA